MAEPKNRRRRSRVALPHSVKISSGDAKIEGGQDGNISAGGLYVHSDETLPVGASCDVEIVGCPGDDPIRARGKVHRKTADGFAVKFTEFDIECFESLKALLMALAEDDDQLLEEFDDYIGWETK